MGNPGDTPPPPPNHQQRSTLNKPQDLYPDEDEPQQFPPPHDRPHSFPPPHDDEDDYATPVKPHAFPPTQDDDYTSPPVKPQAFPPPHTNFQQPFQPAQNFAAPPVHGGVPVGHPAMQGSPFNRPPTPMAAPATLNGWSSELFDCMKDPQNALITAFFPCVTFGQIAEIIDSGHTSCGTSGMMYGVIAFCIAMPCIMSCTYRTKLRSKFGLIETPAPDWAVHCFCEWCALCQEYRELKDKGYDPAIGWLGNVAVQQQQKQQQFPMAAPMGQRMGP
ncbi:unnamed protein product [Fraxinus pennsylvanica]|uniref:Uncharacterized protein n=1 Tax=Fraxinus pennsylvanica TaxID=56036 RepID=A0AAD2AJL5_9LAMI|nr:unnamed protein product [Fraxinus pennsylvanica]